MFAPKTKSLLHCVKKEKKETAQSHHGHFPNFLMTDSDAKQSI